MQLPEGGEIEAQISNKKMNINRSTKAQLTTETPLLGRCCYKPFFFTTLKKMTTEKLTREQQQELLNTLFGFELVNTNDDHWVLYDEEGDEFYESNDNCQFDFSTLAGIFSYTAHKAKNQGYSDCQFQMRKVLGVQ